MAANYDAEHGFGDGAFIYFSERRNDRKSLRKSSIAAPNSYLRRILLFSLLAIVVIFLYNVLSNWFIISSISSSMQFYIVILLVAPVTSGCLVLAFSWSLCSSTHYCKHLLLVPSFTATALLFYAWYIDPFFPSSQYSLSQHPIATCGPNHSEKPIEVVYTWVNVSDARWRQKAKHFKCSPQRYLTGEGDIDPFDSLKYSMRSLQKNAGDIFLKILIVTERDQAPGWLNISHPLVKIVYHDEFMPAESAPVFNSNPTEYLLFNLKEAGFIKQNCFLYLNDDFFINRQLSLGDLIAGNGRLIFNSVIHLDTPFQVNSLFGGVNDSSFALSSKDYSDRKGFLDLPFGMWKINGEHQEEHIAAIADPHVPYVINAEAFGSFMVECGASCQRFARSRCVRRGPMPMSSYQNYLATRHPELVQFVPPLLALRLRLPWGISGVSARVNDFLIKLVRPMFVYIQSHDSVEQDADYVFYIRKYLETSFPIAAPWELS
jgi:hypothetical protein